MLNELQRLHAKMVRHLDDLDLLTAEDKPSINELTATRLALTRASRARTLLLERVYDELLREADLVTKMALTRLQTQGKENLSKSGAHIGEWTLREVANRWADYCAASNRLRAEMRRRIATEKKVVYPLLGKADPAVKVA